MNKERRRSAIIIALVTILLLLVVLSFVPTCMQAFAKEELLSKSEGEYAALIKNSGIDIPSDFDNPRVLGDFVKTTVEHVVADPNYCFAYNYDKALQFAEDIRTWVLATYPQAARTYSEDISYFHPLQDSLVQDSFGNWVSIGGGWNDLWSNFNCYAFSISMWRKSLNSQDKPYQPGMFSGEHRFAAGTSVEVIAQLVEDDLNASGMSNIETSATIPSINDGQELICVRVGPQDYHFMKYDLATDAWYHKPGLTAVLKYKYVPSNDRIWTNEFSRYGDEYLKDREYDSNIIFIKYDKNTKTLTPSGNTDIQINLNPKQEFAQKINVSTKALYKFKFVSNSRMNVWLCDESMTFIKQYSGTTVDFNETLDSGTYHFAVAFAADDSSGNITAKLQHIHNYTAIYRRLNGTQHKSFCNCGKSVTDMHVIKASDTGSVKTCILCFGKVDEGITIFANAANALLVTDNGSYILPSGITVLVDADIEAYFAGTLAFKARNQSAA